MSVGLIPWWGDLVLTRVNGRLVWLSYACWDMLGGPVLAVKPTVPSR